MGWSSLLLGLGISARLMIILAFVIKNLAHLYKSEWITMVNVHNRVVSVSFLYSALCHNGK